MPGEVVVGFRPGTSQAATRAALQRTGVEQLSTPLAPFSTVAVLHGVSVQQAVTQLRRRRAVAWAVPDYIAHMATAAASG